MSFISVPDAFPSMIRAIGRTAALLGPTCDERDIVEAMVPDWLLAASGNRNLGKEKNRVRAAVKEAVRADILRDAGGTFLIGEHWRESLALDAPHERFIVACATQLRDGSHAGLGDLARAAAWVL